MKITLATHIVVEHVGNQVFLLDSVGKEVYCLPAEGITHYTSETKTLVVTSELVPEVKRLVDSGVATTTGLISRRAVVGSTGALIGGGLVAMSMPTLARAQSVVGGVVPLVDGAGIWAGRGTGISGGTDFSDAGIALAFNADQFPGWGPLSQWTVTVFGAPFSASYDSLLGYFLLDFDASENFDATQAIGSLIDADSSGEEEGFRDITIRVTDGVRTADVVVQYVGDEDTLQKLAFGFDLWSFPGTESDVLDIFIDLRGIPLSNAGVIANWTIVVFGTEYIFKATDPEDLPQLDEDGILFIPDLDIDASGTPLGGWRAGLCAQVAEDLAIPVELKDGNGATIKNTTLLYVRDKLVDECRVGVD